MNTATGAAWLLNFLKAERKSKPETVRQLAEYCLGWPYVWASNGEMCTPEWRKNRIPYCNEQKYADAIWDNCLVLSGKQPACDGCKWVDTRCFDCQGFVHWLLEQAGVPLYGAGATTQWNTASNWAAKGEIKNIPRDLVCCVYKYKDGKMSHAGMYVGTDVDIIHCSTTVKTDMLPGKPAWTHWGIPKGLYSTEQLRKAGFNMADDANIPTLRKGVSGEDVLDLQMLLNAKYGFNLDLDGNFGKATEAAVKEFQKQHGLTVDGIVGPKTWKALGVSGNTNPPADNGNNEIKPSESLADKPDIILTDEIKTAIRAAYASAKTACDILRKLVEG